MDENRIKEVLSNEEFVKSLMEMENAEQVQAALKGKGIELSLDEINKIQKRLAAAAVSGDELDLDQLDDVAGGASVGQLVDYAIGNLNNSIQNIISKRW